MKNFLKGKQVRVVAFLLAVLFGVMSVFSCAVIYITAGAGFYNGENSFDNVLKDRQEYLQRMYSYWIVYSLNNPNSDMAANFSDSNMKYFVRKNGEEISANCKEEEIENPYEVTFDEGDCYNSSVGGIFPLEICNNVFNVILQDRELFYEPDRRNRTMDIGGILFNKEDGKFYLNLVNFLIIPLNEVWLSYESKESGEEVCSAKYVYDEDKGSYYAKVNVYLGEKEYNVAELDEIDEETGIGKKRVKFESTELKDWDTLYFCDFGFTDVYCSLKDVIIEPDLAGFSKYVDNDAEVENVYGKTNDHTGGRYRWDNCYLEIYSTNPIQGERAYSVLTEVNPYESMNEDTVDVFYQLETLLNTLYNMRYVNIIIAISGGLLCLFAICLYVWNTGVCREDKNRKRNIIRKCPLEIYLLATGAVIIFALSALGYELSHITRASNYRITDIVWICIMFTACSFAVGVAVIGEMYARYRDKVLVENTMTCTGFRFIKKECKKLLQIICDNINLIIRMALIVVVFSVVELMVIIETSYETDNEIIIWTVWKLVEIPFLFKLTIDLKRLQDKARSVADGGVGDNLDTGKMFWELRKHGEYLNKIDEGVEIAVQKQMKSERMRTELITNVSHDIKTPLTSIINYVDLLKKDGVGEEEKEQYLEVLSRKSAELKKLIEDLIEASKASTGNVSVDFQRCDIGVLMVQVLGEFEEKLAGNELQLVAKENVEPVEIMADRRHLWRVFDNLMNNICKYSQSGTRVYIDVETKDGEVHIIFKNTSKYQLNISGEELLERFVRGDSSRNTDGNGLGLAIAQSLTELMRGTIDISVDGDLFKVILAFPISKGEEVVMEFDEN